MISTLSIVASVLAGTILVGQAASTSGQTAPAARQAAPEKPAALEAPPIEIVASGDTIDSLPPIEVNPPSIDMGIAAPKHGMKGSTQLTNTGTKPLRIMAITPSCKCTTINDLVGTVIEPGKSIALNAALEPVSMPQTQNASLRILVEGYGKILEVPVKGEVAMPVRALPPMINAVQGQPQVGRVVIESVDKKPFTICAISGRKPEYIGFTPGTDEPRAMYLVKYDLSTWTPEFPAYLVVETDRPDCPVFDIWVRSERTIPRPGLRMKEYRLNAGRIDTGGSTDYVVELEDSGEEVIAVESGSPTVDMKLIGQVGDGKLRKLTLRITPKGPQSGLLYAPLTLYGREKDQPLILFASVRPKDSTGCVGCQAVDAPPSTAGADQPRAIR